MAKDEDIKDLKESVRELDRKQDEQTSVLTDLRISTAKQEAALVAHIHSEEQIYDRISSVDQKMGEYNQLLAVHIEGVNQLRQTNSILEQKLDLEKTVTNARLQILEAPLKWVMFTKDGIVLVAKIVAIAGAVAATAKWALKLF
jgi:chromosome segregation ATPase